VVLLTTGDELRPPQTPTEQLKPQQIRNSNASLLCGLLAQWGISLYQHTHVPDDPQQTLAAARRSLGESNIVLTTGGVSVGTRDFLPDAWKQLGLDVVLHGVAMQPGKPLFVAQPPDVPEKIVIGLPGNPVSVLMSAILFVQPVLRRLRGLDVHLPWQKRSLSQAVQPNAKRQAFRAGHLLDDGRVQVIAWHGSGDLSHTAGMTGVVRLPAQSESLNSGDEVTYLPVQ
jgi:molybdopterin molybdotransferase